MDDFEELKDLHGGSNCKCEKAREEELEVEPEDVIELLQSYDKFFFQVFC